MKKCRDCGANHNYKNKLCDICSDRAKKSSRKRANALTKKGLCVSCGKNKKTISSLRCQACNDNMKKRGDERIKKYLEQNKCTTCGRDKSNVAMWHTGRCPGCHLRFKFNFSGTKDEAEEIINNKLKSQNFKCALTGRHLGDNKYHIDHIVPRSLGGTDDPNNLQLIVDEANVFKTNMTMEQIIKLATDIVLHSGV